MMWQHVVAGVRTTVCRWQVTTRWHHSPATISIRYQSSATITRAHHSPATITRGHHSQIPINRGHHLSARQYKGQLQVSEEVAEALHQQAPVVALESTIITHGMPYPHNLSTAHMVEAVVRENGAVPATIAILNGKIHIGLTSAELERLAVTDSDSIKTSRRDLPYVLSQGLTGGTTVSSTMIAAHMAGIDVFMTGGVGGVHRGAESTMDVSADLTELGRTPVAVISAGIKSILDIGRTLEFLETEGVCVATLGSTKDFPAFFTPTSGFQSPYNVPTPAQAAKLIDMSLSVGLGSGVLIAVPIPEEEAAGGAEIEAAIQTAVHEAVERNVAGKDVTPFILARVNELTEGRSLTANIALIRNNAMKGGQIAVELSKLRGLSSMNPPQSPSTICTDEPCVRTISRIDLHEVDLTHACRPVVVGGINVDFTARVRVPKPKANGATYPGDVCQSFGGVGRNLASCLSRLGDNPLFISAMGKDNYAEYFTQQAAHMDLRGMQLCEGVSSAMYCAILGVDGELMYGLGDFVVHDQITPDYVSQFAADLKSASLVCLDGNIPKETIACITDMCHEVGVPVWFEPTDLHQVTKPILAGVHHKLTYISPNLNELRILHGHLTGTTHGTAQGSNPVGDVDETMQEVLRLSRPLVDNVPNVLVTLGHHGAAFLTQDTAYYCPARPAHVTAPQIASVSGAGDCLAAGFISSLVSGRSHQAALKAGILASQHSLCSRHAVPVSMTADTISASAVQQLDPWEVREIVMSGEVY